MIHADVAQANSALIDLSGMDELEIAHAIADGRLTSPQTVGGFALYAMRMSGTGVSYRRGLDEFVWRDPAIYLSQDMIDRCAGLPVIMEHPEASTLNSDEFADRVVGAAMFGYVVDDELWCIARIYDADAIELMDKQQLSTSPAVVFGDPSVNSKTEFKGKTVLIEGNPTILDHLAICRRGVWDKGGPAAGIDVVRKDSVTMTEEEKKADAARKDAEEKEKMEKEKADSAKADAAAKADADAGKKLDTILSHLDSLGKRMDAYDAKCDAEDKAKKEAEEKEKEEKESKDDPKELAADKAKKDAAAKDAEMMMDKKKDAEEKEKEEEEEKKADAARADADDMRKQIADLQSALSSVRSKMPKPTADADYADMAQIQADADRIYSAHSMNAPRPMDGETQLAYRRRLATGMKHYSDDWKDVELGVVAVDAKAFSNAERQIYADAMNAAMHPAVPGDGLLEIRRKDPDTGHLIKEFHGQPRAWMSAFSGGPPRLARFNLDKRGNN